MKTGFYFELIDMLAVFSLLEIGNRHINTVLALSLAIHSRVGLYL